MVDECRRQWGGCATGHVKAARKKWALRLVEESRRRIKARWIIGRSRPNDSCLRGDRARSGRRQEAAVVVSKEEARDRVRAMGTATCRCSSVAFSPRAESTRGGDHARTCSRSGQLGQAVQGGQAQWEAGAEEHRDLRPRHRAHAPRYCPCPHRRTSGGSASSLIRIAAISTRGDVHSAASERPW